MSENTFQVWRGTELLSVDSRLIDLNGLVTSSGEVDREEVINILHHLQLHSSYEGSDCVNSFYANKKILLKGCGFFGPLSKKFVAQKVTYQVDIRIERVWISKSSQQKSKTLINCSKTIQIDMESCFQADPPMFNVDFATPVLIDPNVIRYDIVFRLKGPPSFELDPTKLKTHVETNGIKFFFWPGSKQMPVLHFSNLEE